MLIKLFVVTAMLLTSFRNHFTNISISAFDASYVYNRHHYQKLYLAGKNIQKYKIKLSQYDNIFIFIAFLIVMYN